MVAGLSSRRSGFEARTGDQYPKGRFDYMWYVKEAGFYYEILHGPYTTKEEAIANKPKDKLVGRLEAIIKYTIEYA